MHGLERHWFWLRSVPITLATSPMKKTAETIYMWLFLARRQVAEKKTA
jgi:hypothetical protein